MSKKKDIVPTTPTPAPLVSAYDPEVVENPAAFFDGLELVNPIAIAEGCGIRGQFYGDGGQVEFERAEGGIDFLNTWRVKVNDTMLRVLGSTQLDRELRNVANRWELPIECAIFRHGQKDIGGGRRLSLYHVAVGPGKLRPEEPADPTKPSPF